MEELIKLDAYPIRGLVRRLLQDKTTRKNIMFASYSYADYGAGYRDNSQMTEGMLLGFDSCEIQPRVYKAASEQTERTRKRAEVFTPAWIVNQMNNHCDAEWFGRPNVFNKQDGQSWKINTEPILFPEGKDWKQYVDSRRLEITCGEAPYIVSRYDTTTGEIIPIEKRIGILDRKLRIVNENTADEDEWFKWALRAFQSVYGYEYQGDNLFIARMNLIYTLADYINAKWNRQATQKELEKFLNVICWNIWQMDGMNDTPPYGVPKDDVVQMSLLEEDETTEGDEIIYCKIYDWRADTSKLFKDLKKRGKGMKFDFVIGNPPYQEASQGTKKADESIYHYFMDAAYKVGEKVELITPSRFLFNNGNTPAAWNNKILNDEHFKVLLFEPIASKIFPSVGFKGGVAIHYRDEKKHFGAIRQFTAFNELNSILKKVLIQNENSLTLIINNQNKFNLKNLYEDFPELKEQISSNGKEKRMTSGCFKYDCFHDIKENDNDVKILGLMNGKRCYKYINSKYIEKDNPNFDKYKVIVPANNGSGALGEVLSTPLIGTPLIGYTQTFIAIGKFDDIDDCQSALKYVKSKFCRVMLGVLKITQNGKREMWAYVPLQDFTSNSDIDWTQPIAAIDQQLYKKYDLTPDEINFIETHVKEME